MVFQKERKDFLFYALVFEIILFSEYEMLICLTKIRFKADNVDPIVYIISCYGIYANV